MLGVIPFSGKRARKSGILAGARYRGGGILTIAALHHQVKLFIACRCGGILC